MTKHKWQIWRDGIGITLLAVLMTFLLEHGIQPFPFPSSIQQTVDFRLSDLFQAILYDKHESTLNNDIVIVATDNCQGRMELVQLLDSLNRYEPRVIGLDIFFSQRKDSAQDDTLVKQLTSMHDRLVCSSKIGDTLIGDQRFLKVLQQSFFDSDTCINRYINYGYINFTTDSVQEVVREFYPYAYTSDNQELLSFASAILQKANHQRFETLKARKNEKELIHFHTTRQFAVVPYHDVLEHRVNPNMLRDKIVFIGDTNNVSDLHRVPLQIHKTGSADHYNNYATPGVLIHAYILQTMLDAEYIAPSSKVIGWAIAFLFFELLLVVCLLAKYYMGDAAGLVVRLAQFALLFLAIWIGTFCFNSIKQYVDFSFALSMLVTGLIARDLWFGFAAFYGKVQTFVKKMTKKKNKKPYKK